MIKMDSDEKNIYALASGRDGSGLIVIFLASSALLSLASSASLSALALASAFLTYIFGFGTMSDLKPIMNFQFNSIQFMRFIQDFKIFQI